MQNQVYSRYIYQMLMEYGRVFIPSVGTFVLDYAEATLDRSLKIISPPSSSLNFTTAADENHKISDLLIETGMSQEHATLLENLIVKDYSVSKEKQILFELHGLGTLINRVFIEKEAGIFNRYYGLKEVSAIPVPVKATQVIHDKDYLFNLTKGYQTKENSSFNSFLWPILISAITILVIVLWFLSDRSAAFTHKVSGTEMNKPSDEQIIASDSFETDIDKITFQTDTALFPEKDLVEPDGNTNPIDNKYESVNGQTNAKNGQIGPSCVIIVGAFRYSSNANRMLKRLSAKGYVTYSAMHNGLQRVGITYDCSTNDPIIFKAKVREQFNKQAWHLHDTI
ncbi:MAG: hypothetical protein WAT37_02265 [Saprospiraceae bacterium]